MGQPELRQQLQDLLAEHGRVVFEHHQDMYAEIAALLGQTVSRTQMRRALGALMYAGTIRVSHKQVDVEGVGVVRRHVVQYVRKGQP